MSLPVVLLLWQACVFVIKILTFKFCFDSTLCKGPDHDCYCRGYYEYLCCESNDEEEEEGGTFGGGLRGCGGGGGWGGGG